MGKVKALKLINSGQITKSNLKNVFTPEQLKQFASSYKLVKLGDDIIEEINITDKDFDVLEDIMKYISDKSVYLSEVQKVLNEFNIKKYKSFELYYLLNHKFIQYLKGLAK